MITSVINNRIIEISVENEDNFLTQSYPTYFHEFYKKKRLIINNESSLDYKEISLAEKTQLEAHDASFEKPAQWLIDLFNSDPYGGYEENRGYINLHGLNDITTQQAIDIVKYGNHIEPKRFVCLDHSVNPYIRTNLTPSGICWNDKRSLNMLCEGQRKLEIFYLKAENFGQIQLLSNTDNLYHSFYNCQSLRTIIGIIDLNNITANYAVEYAFKNCYALQDVKIRHLKTGISFGDSPLLSLESLQYMIENAANTTAVVITLHADAFERLTEEIITCAEEKQIAFAT